MHHRSVVRTDPRYKQLRCRNNQSVQRSREKSRRQQEQTLESIHQLEKENEQLLDRIQSVKREYQQLHQIFKQHTGIDIDQMTTSDLKTKTQVDVTNLDGSTVLINGVQYKIYRT